MTHRELKNMTINGSVLSDDTRLSVCMMDVVGGNPRLDQVQFCACVLQMDLIKL